jgi:3-hydroxyisobutyrate dehydrogenase
MGQPVCARLAAAGFSVTATDARAQLRNASEAAGARWAGSVAEAAAEAELLITSLPGSDDVLEVMPTALEALAPGSCWLEMSTAAPHVACEIAGLAAPHGVRAVDAPVGGGPEAARTGRLLVFAGGEIDDDVRPVLDVLAERVLTTGAHGSGYATKLLVNALWFTHAVAGAEALAVGRRLGLDLETLLESLRASAGASRFLSEHADALLDGDDLTTFPLSGCCRELTDVLTLADENDVPLDVIRAVRQIHELALDRYGDVDGELLGARLVAERAGVDLRRS